MLTAMYKLYKSTKINTSIVFVETREETMDSQQLYAPGGAGPSSGSVASDDPLL